MNLLQNDVFYVLSEGLKSALSEMQTLADADVECLFEAVLSDHLPPPPQSSMNRMAIQALEKMETRKFKAKGKGQRESSCGASDSLSSSSTSDCAICLEKYIDGEVRKDAYLGITSCHVKLLNP